MRRARRRETTRRLRFGGLAVAAGLGALVSGASASGTAAKRLDSFAGSCSFPITAYFDPPATSALRPGVDHVSGLGSCNGTLDGRQLRDAPVQFHAGGPTNPSSCTTAASAPSWPGIMTFPGGTTVELSLQFRFILTEANVTYAGASAGTGHGHASFVTSRTSATEETQRCSGADGGLAEAGVNITLITDTPLASETIVAGPRPGAAREPALRLSVRPHTALAGRRVTFTFLVRRPSGGTVTGARVWLGGRSTRTGPRGRARIVLTPHGTRPLIAHASRRGFRPARATIFLRAAADSETRGDPLADR